MIEHGHHLQDIKDYTISQVNIFLKSIKIIESERDARLLAIIATGSQGDGKSIKDMYEDINQN